MPVERLRLSATSYELPAIIFIGILLSALSYASNCYAAPCYGTTMPERNKFSARLESYSLFKRHMADGWGNMRSQQEFYGMSDGVFDWLSIDLKAGAGNINEHRDNSANVSYASSFAGGYGLRAKLLDKNNIKAVLGFQHISVHPKHTYVTGVKNRAILDDWQWSLLGSYTIKGFTPYLGTRWSRADYIHWTGTDRKRQMSDRTRDIGLICGIDIPLTKKIWVNLEGSAFDSSSFTGSLNYQF